MCTIHKSTSVFCTCKTFLIHCRNIVTGGPVFQVLRRHPGFNACEWFSHNNYSDSFDWLFWLGLNCRLEGNCGFLTANLYAKSVFGEDALVNVSIEKKNKGTLGGSIKIKSKSQGIALGLSNKISLKQKGKGGN